MNHSDRVSRCFSSVMLFMFLLALELNVMPVAHLEGMFHQSDVAILELEKEEILLAGTPHGPIVIDGDANFSDTALLEGWPGDGSPETPYIIEGLDIDISSNDWYCISITNTQVNFIISNCNLTGASYHVIGHRGYSGAGIFLENVTNCELVKNIIDSDAHGIDAANLDSSTITDNTCNCENSGICLRGSTYNTIANNTCNDNEYGGIRLDDSSYNIVANNTCNSKGWESINLRHSHDNTVVNNTCNYNVGEAAIRLEFSDSNTVFDNTCNNNEWGINLHESYGNTLINNTCNNNTCGIYLYNSGLLEWGVWGTECIVANNTCYSNTEDGIHIQSSFVVIVENNTCYSNVWGIYIGHSVITVNDNTCNYNRIGIHIHRSDVDTVTHNTCNNNSIGIFLYYSTFESWESNTYVGNTEHDTIEEFETRIPPQPTTPPPPAPTTMTDGVDMTMMLLVGILLLPSSVIVLSSRWRISFSKGNKDIIFELALYRLVSRFHKKKDDQDDIVVPVRYRLVSRLRKRRPIKRADGDKSLEE